MDAVKHDIAIGGNPVSRLLALGVGLWAAGAVALHYGAPVGLFTPFIAAPLLVAAVPVAWRMVRLVERVAGFSPARSVEAVALASMPALLLDGVALTWMPSVYSTQAVEQRAAGAFLLWFVGVSLAIAMFRRGNRSI